MKRFVLDSYALIAYFEDEPGADRVAQILGQLVRGKTKGYMSVVPRLGSDQDNYLILSQKDK